MWPFDQIGTQVSRAGNAIANTWGGGVKTNPDEYDFWGNPIAKPGASGSTLKAATGGSILNNQSGFSGSQVPVNSYGLPGYDQATASVTTTVAPGAVKMNPAQESKMIDTITYNNGNKAMNSGSPQAFAPPTANVGSSNSSATAGPATGAGLSSLDQERLNLAKSREAAINATIEKMNGLSNPYDTNSEAFQHSVADARNRTVRSFAGGMGALQSALAERGMLGSGFEAAGAGNFIGRRSTAINDTENGMYTSAIKNGADFELGRQRSILQALTANPLGDTLGDLSSDYYSRARDVLNDQRLSDSERNQFWAAVTQAAAEHGPEAADAVLGAIKAWLG